MIAYKRFTADGVTNRFLSDIIIRSEQFTRVYSYVYDNTLNIDGSEDVLQNPLLPWAYPTNLYRRGGNFPSSSFDLINLDKWDLADNSILFYTVPPSGSKVYIEVATTAEEFGSTLTAPSVNRAEAAAAAALASETAAGLSAAASALSETNAGASETAAGLSAAAAAISETAANASKVAAALSESNAAASETAAGLSETNAAASEVAAATSETNAGVSATNAQLREWEAEADALTALSYASEAEDVPVNIVTSDGDGTFTYTPQTGIYSAKHHQLKSAVFNPALYAALSGATFTGQVKGITPVSVEDLTRKDYVDLKVSAAAKLLAEYTVVGAAATSIDFTGLDIGTHKSYRIEIENVNAIANSYVHLFANGDTTPSNYTEQQVGGVSTTAVVQSIAAPRLGLCKVATTVSTIDVTVKQVSGYVIFQSYNFAETSELTLYAGRTNATKTNLTQLTFTHSAGAGFGIGSKIRIYRGDV